MHFEIEGNTIYLVLDSRNLGGINSSELRTDVNTLAEAFEKITQKHGMNSDDIAKMVSIVGKKGNIIGFGSDVLSFCYWCDYMERTGVVGVQNLVKHLKTRESFQEILSDIFVAEIAAKYARGHTVELKIRKRERGCDLIIDSLKCDCKVRIGYVDQRSLDLQHNSMDEEKSLDVLVQDENRRILKNVVEEAFSKQGVDVIFIKATTTSFGFSQVVNFFESNQSNDISALPTLERHTIVYYAKYNGQDLWKVSRYVSPEENH